MVETNEVVSRVVAVLEGQFPVLASLPVRPDTVLVSSGYLDSFGIVTLVAELERVFGFDLDVEAVDVEAFETPNAIAALCIANLAT